jgi:ribosome biogenesis protein UTP30
MLSKAIGTKFFSKKKQPIPIKLGREEALPFVIQKCLYSTYMYLSSGTCITIKVGHTGMSSNKLLENITAVCESVPMKVPRKWCNVRSISIKTVDSVALPVYNRTPEELEHIAQLAKVDGSSTSTPPSVSNDKDEEAKQKKKNVKSSAMVVDTPLARALKKQKIVNTPNAAPDPNKTNKRKGTMDDDESVIAVAKTTSKLSKKVNTKSELMKEKEDKSTVISTTTATSTKLSKKTKSMEDTTTTIPSSKKVKLNTNDESSVVKSPTKKKVEETAAISSSKKVKLNTNDESVDTTTITSSKKVKLNTNNDIEVKSPKKKKVDTKAGAVKTSNNEDNTNFVSATKFTGSKKGYVFTKGKLGLGYYKDMLPIVDKVWRANLGRVSNRTGGRGESNNRKSMGGGQKRKKGGNNSRRSY